MFQRAICPFLEGQGIPLGLCWVAPTQWWWGAKVQLLLPSSPSPAPGAFALLTTSMPTTDFKPYSSSSSSNNCHTLLLLLQIDFQEKIMLMLASSSSSMQLKLKQIQLTVLCKLSIRRYNFSFPHN